MTMKAGASRLVEIEYSNKYYVSVDN